MIKNILCITLLICSVFTEAQTSTIKNLDKLFDKFEIENKAMGTISIAKNGAEFYQKNIGFSNIKNKTIGDKFTKYRIGSITKIFTTTIILQQIDEGKLTLSTLLKEYFPAIQNADKITIEDLLRHESGLANITENKDIATWITKPQTREKMIVRFVKNGIQFEPKEKSKYSNTNFIILSYISEMIDKKSFSEILKSRIIKPLNLKRTEFGNPIIAKNNEALAYYFEGNKWNLIDIQTHMSAPMGAGAIVSTSTELNIFFTNLFSKKLTSEASLKNLMTIKKGKGLGIMQFDFKGLKVFGHDGEIDGFQSYALYIPERNISMSFTFNGLNSSTMPVVISILEAYFKNDSSLKKENTINLKPEELDAYLGIYSGKTFPAKVTFTKKDNILFAQATGQPIFKLIAIKKDSFLYNAMGIRFDFNLPEKTIELTFGGKKHLLERE
ncbi:serine hydrolase domain-containing protein [Polaribacter sp. Hel1_85]|uniref:serine hydrolase domain-containing protein n=1 Tax=Polaribacter sp. Hel1_85 TaxID=1250005 RepID=UPI00052D782A|nr:serine hydrolase domain-containing protein [Polaribacter sp. Hel1_85]KGL61904.1 serine-type D-Ala-D-Ala carboxypeptidase [Polaribacter sp. Hel1_85]